MSAIDDLHPDLQALIGTVIHGRYRVDKLLGRGGMGAVFKGHHLGLRRDVAIKVLRPEIGRDANTGKRFDREAQSVSRLDHPNCVRVTDNGTTESGIKYLVMELLDGAELQASLGQPWAPARAVEMVVQILEGLDHAHHAGIVHRDLKPENVFVTRDHRGRELAKLVDFGIAKLLDEAGQDRLTRAGAVFGTPRYMSPEQASGGKLDERTDLYASGLILYEMLTGRPPFVSDDAAALLRMHILAPPPELPPSVPKSLVGVVDKLLAKSRNDRYASAREVIDVLEGLRPSLAAALPAMAVAPSGPTGIAATPSMATAFEPSSPPPSPPPAPPLPPNQSFVTGPLAAPAWPPSDTSGIPAGSLPPPPGLPITSEGPAAPINPPTGPMLVPMHPSAMAPTQYGSTASITGQRRMHPWLPWAIGAGAVLLLLMAFGAGQALQSSSSDDGSAPVGDPSTWDSVPPRGTFDSDCSDGVCECRGRVDCELSCGRDCAARCVDGAHCELTVGDGSSVLCDGDHCEVECLGDCLVECPHGGCEVTCPHPSDTHGHKHGHKDDKKGFKKKRPKQAKRCGDMYLCGRECEDERD